MKPVICQVSHNPPVSHGDCVRACVASVLELVPDEVPHFFHDGNGNLAFDRMREFLRARGLIAAYFPLSGELLLSDVLEFMKREYAGIHYLMFCSNRDGNHCVVGENDTIVHDPAWIKCEIIGPHSDGLWILIILAKL